MNEKYQPLSEEEITAQAEEFDRRAENVVALQGELNALVFRNASISLDPEEVFWGTASMSRVSERLRWERLGRAAQAPFLPRHPGSIRCGGKAARLRRLCGFRPCGA